MKPNFVIIGGQKCGSSFIHDCLAEHPDVYIPEDEIPFFEDPIYNEEKLDDFFSLFSGAEGKSALGVKRPSYLSKPECPQRLKKHLPKAKLIAILRNPIQRSISAYFHLMKMGLFPIIPIEEGLNKIIHTNKYKKNYPRSTELIEFGFYTQHLKRYFKYFPKKQIKIILYEDLIKNSLSVMKDVYGFLGINKNYQPKDLNIRPQEGIYSLTRLRLQSLRFPFVYDFDKKLGRVYNKKQTKIDKFFLTLIYGIDSKFLKSILGNNKPKISQKLKEDLLKLYLNDITQLEKLLQKDLSIWKKI